jgi:phosphoribosyl 1,2-cyclic phosphate phosphodiesterase
LRVTILGCGASTGVPAIGPQWGSCDPRDPRNRRRRSSLLVDIGICRILIDTSPDLREQLLDAGVRRLDAVLLTHAHADHLHGIDDLRSVNRLMQAPIPLFATEETFAEIRQRFPYIDLTARPDPTSRYYRPTLIPHPIPHRIDGSFAVAGIEIAAFPQDHGYGSTLGFRIGRFAYSTDVVNLDERAFGVLAGIDVWIVDCLRREPHPTHSHLAKTLAWIARVRPRRAVLTHLDFTMDYAALAAELPAGVEPGHDGLAIELADP